MLHYLDHSAISQQSILEEVLILTCRRLDQLNVTISNTLYKTPVTPWSLQVDTGGLHFSQFCLESREVVLKNSV